MCKRINMLGALWFLVITFVHAQYWPVVLMHGINTTNVSMVPVMERIEPEHHGTFIFNVEIGRGWISSFEELWHQIDAFAKQIHSREELRGGFHLIAHSQGGLLARGYVAKYNDDPTGFHVRNLITWGTPHRGVDGIPYETSIKPWVCNLISRLADVHFLEELVSPTEIWHDPDAKRYKRYINTNFLPVLNNQVGDDEKKERYKNNVCALQNLVLFKSTNDEVIKPQGSAWGCFGRSLDDDPFYTEDWAGFGTLKKGGRLHLEEVHCTHEDYEIDEEVWQKTLPFLTKMTPEEEQERAAMIEAALDAEYDFVAPGGPQRSNSLPILPEGLTSSLMRACSFRNNP